nr:hypothetical protein GCM10020092_071690 [Actinoplanes digitatis]
MPLLPDRPEVFGKQSVQRAGVGPQLGLVEGTPQPVNVGDHAQILLDPAPGGKTGPRDRPIRRFDSAHGRANPPVTGSVFSPVCSLWNQRAAITARSISKSQRGSRAQKLLTMSH